MAVPAACRVRAAAALLLGCCGAALASGVQVRRLVGAAGGLRGRAALGRAAGATLLARPLPPLRGQSPSPRLPPLGCPHRLPLGTAPVELPRAAPGAVGGLRWPQRPQPPGPLPSGAAEGARRRAASPRRAGGPTLPGPASLGPLGVTRGAAAAARPAAGLWRSVRGGAGRPRSGGPVRRRVTGRGRSESKPAGCPPIPAQVSEARFRFGYAMVTLSSRCFVVPFPDTCWPSCD